MNDAQSAAPIGVVEEVSGPVVDIACSGALPGMHDALRVELDGGECVLEVRHHLDARRLRAVALHATAGLR
ncbi:MAG: F0F1 ATP synthase subunit beta, partial [Burkholderiales bacterium]